MDRHGKENHIKISIVDDPNSEEPNPETHHHHHHIHNQKLNQNHNLYQKQQHHQDDEHDHTVSKSTIPTSNTTMMMMRIERKTSDAMPLSILLHKSGNNDDKDHDGAVDADTDTLLFSPPMGLLDIMRESSALLRMNSSLLMWTLSILICPLSALVLSTGFISAHLQSHGKLALASSLTILPPSIRGSRIFRAMLQASISLAISSPLYFTVWLLAKAFIIFIISSSYASRKSSLRLFSSIAFKLWKRLAYTCLWIAGLLVAMAAVAGLAICTVVKAKDLLPADMVTLMEMAMGAAGCVVLAHIVIVANLATVVCIVEDHTMVGWAAILRSVHLVHGRRQVALYIFLATTACAAMVESLYQYRVIGVPNGNYHIDVASRLWEAPLLIFMYSFLYLYDTIMSCVFYYTCATASPCSPSSSADEDD